MKEIAQHLLVVMREALEKKRSGAQGNFQGILNQCKVIFETTIRLQAGTDKEIQPLIAEAQALQIAGQRITPRVGTIKTAADAPSRSSQVDMAAAFEFQKKRVRGRKGAVAGKPRPIRTVPAIQPIIETDTAEKDSGERIDPELVKALLDLRPAEFRDRFGGVDGLRAFARETFGLEFDDAANYSRIVLQVKAELGKLATGTEETQE